MPKLSPPFRYGQVVIGRELMRTHRMHNLNIKGNYSVLPCKSEQKSLWCVFLFFLCTSVIKTKQKQKHLRMYSCTHITATMPHHSPVATACTAVAMETPASLVILWIGCNEQGFRGENSLTWWQVETVNWSTSLEKTLDSDFLRLSEHLV